MLRLHLALILVTSLGLVASSGCEKKPPAAAQPGELESPPQGGQQGVIVEDPGATPEPGDPPPADSGADEMPGRVEIVATDIPCQSDADCVKDSCCHARGCVAAADAPDCSGAMCTADCQAGTMDCNGGCLCQEGKCAAKLWWAPDPSAPPE